jgi:hypothetical protein
MMADPSFDPEAAKSLMLKPYDWGLVEDNVLLTEEQWKESDYYHKDLKFPDGVWTATAKILKERKEVELNRKELMSKAPQDVVSQVLYFGAGLAAEFTDPFNVPLMLVPIAGEAKWLGALGKNRFIRRGVKGGIEGFVGNIPTEVMTYEQLKKEQAEWTIQDSMFNVMVMGPLAGGTLRNVIGGVGDVRGVYKSLDNILNEEWGFKPLQEKEALTLQAFADLENDKLIKIENMANAQALAKTTVDDMLERHAVNVVKPAQFSFKGRAELVQNSIDTLNRGETIETIGINKGFCYSCAAADVLKSKIINPDADVKLHIAGIDTPTGTMHAYVTVDGKLISDPAVMREDWYNKIEVYSVDENIKLTLVDTVIKSKEKPEVTLKEYDAGKTIEVTTKTGGRATLEKYKIDDIERTNRALGLGLTPEQAENTFNFTIEAGIEGKGEGTAMLTKLIELADEEQMTLFNVPASRGDMSQADLVKWYKKHGFVEKGGGELESEPLVMIREPKVSTDVSGMADRIAELQARADDAVRKAQTVVPEVDVLYANTGIVDVTPEVATATKLSIKNALDFAKEENIKYNGPMNMYDPDIPGGVLHTFTVESGENARLTFATKPGEDFKTKMSARIEQNEAAREVKIKTKKDTMEFVTADGSTALLNKPSPLNVRAFENRAGIKLTSKEGSRLWEFSIVKATTPGEGTGPRILKKIIDTADEEGMIIFGEATAYTDIDKALKQEDLVNWYRRAGWDFIPDTGILIRYPKPTIDVGKSFRSDIQTMVHTNLGSEARIGKLNEEAVAKLNKEHSIGLTLDQERNTFEFNKLKSVSERKGEATAMLKELIVAADEDRITIFNSITPEDITGDMSKADLETWLTKFGFEKVENSTLMVRKNIVKAEVKEPLQFRQDGSIVAPKVFQEEVSDGLYILTTNKGSVLKVQKKGPGEAKRLAKINKFKLTDEQAENFWYGSDVKAKFTGEGEGTKLIARAMDIADEKQATVFLHAVADPNVKGALSQEALKAWYLKKGVIKIEGSGTDMMLRYPKPLSPVAEAVAPKAPTPDGLTVDPIAFANMTPNEIASDIRNSFPSLDQSNLNSKLEAGKFTSFILDTDSDISIRRIAELEKLTEGANEVPKVDMTESDKYDLYYGMDKKSGTEIDDFINSLVVDEKLTEITDPLVRAELIYKKIYDDEWNKFDILNKQEALRKKNVPTKAEIDDVIDNVLIPNEMDEIKLNTPGFDDTKAAQAMKDIMDYKGNDVKLMDRLMIESGLGEQWGWGGDSGMPKTELFSNVKDTLRLRTEEIHYEFALDYQIALDKLADEWRAITKKKGLHILETRDSRMSSKLGRTIYKDQLIKLKGYEAEARVFGEKYGLEGIGESEQWINGQVVKTSVEDLYTSKMDLLSDEGAYHADQKRLDYARLEDQLNNDLAASEKLTPIEAAEQLNEQVSRTGTATVADITDDSPMRNTYNQDVDINKNKTFTEEEFLDMERSGEAEQIQEQLIDAGEDMAREINNTANKLTDDQRAGMDEVYKQIREEYGLREANFNKIVDNLTKCL